MILVLLTVTGFSWVLFSKNARRWRKMGKGEIPIPGSPVSRNYRAEDMADLALANKIEADLEEWGVGPDWEQDRPMPEIWEDDDA